MTKLRTGLGGLAACALIWSCAGSGKGSSSTATSPPPGDPPDPVLNTTVFDETGRPMKCSEPQPKCANEHHPSVEFQDKCRLSGYRMMKCGCQHVCSGNVMAGADEAYDAKGTKRQ